MFVRLAFKLALELSLRLQIKPQAHYTSSQLWLPGGPFMLHSFATTVIHGNDCHRAVAGNVEVNQEMARSSGVIRRCARVVLRPGRSASFSIICPGIHISWLHMAPRRAHHHHHPLINPYLVPLVCRLKMGNICFLPNAAPRHKYSSAWLAMRYPRFIFRNHHGSSQPR